MKAKRAYPYWLSAVVLWGLAVLVTIAPLTLRAFTQDGSAPLSGDTSDAPATTLPAGTLGDTVQVGEMLVSLSTAQGLPRVGLNDLDALITDTAGQPVNDAKVVLDIDMTNMSHGPYMVDCQCTGDGRFSGQANFSMAGPWRVHVSIEKPGEPPLKARFTFRVSGA